MPKDKRKAELLQVLDTADRLTTQARNKAQEMVEQATEAKELLRALRPAVQALPNDDALPGQMWVRLTEGWRAQAAGVEQAFSLVQPSTLSATTQAAAFTTTATSTVLCSWVKRADPAAAQALEAVLHRPGLVKTASTALARFGLDKAVGDTRSPTELLKEASSALARPAGATLAPVAVLVPLREAIQASIAGLLRRRPKQEPAGSMRRKIESIGQQCGYSALPQSHFERLGEEGAALIDDLSGSKQGQLSAENVLALFDTGVRFISAVLEAVDPAKLR